MRAVRQLRKEPGTEHGTIKRVAEQLGIGVESLRGWVKQAEIDAGVKPGTTSADAARVVVGDPHFQLATVKRAAAWAKRSRSSTPRAVAGVA